MAGKKYHGMTLEEIKAKYYVYMAGNEDNSALRHIDGKLSRLWQDVSFYYTDTETMLADAKRDLSRLEDQIELDKVKVKWKYITQNKALPVRERWSDDARETAAIIETNTDKLHEALLLSREVISDYLEELAVWKAVKDNLKFIGDRINNSSMNTAVEAKFMRQEPTNIPIDEDKKDVGKDNVPF